MKLDIANWHEKMRLRRRARTDANHSKRHSVGHIHAVDAHTNTHTVTYAVRSFEHFASLINRGDNV